MKEEGRGVRTEKKSSVKMLKCANREIADKCLIAILLRRRRHRGEIAREVQKSGSGEKSSKTGQHCTSHDFLGCLICASVC